MSNDERSTKPECRKRDMTIRRYLSIRPSFEFRHCSGLFRISKFDIRVLVMLFSEVIKMAWSSLGANKLRSALTMLGITIGVFSVISVMTAIGALQYSIENGISFLGSNIFQFAKYPANVSASGDVQEKFRNRHNITYKQALHYYRLMEGEAREICLKSFGYEVKGQAVYNGIKTTPSLLVVGSNRSFLTANAFTLGYGRNLNDEDV